MDLASIRRDLIAEHEALDAIVESLTLDQWFLPTPSARWSVADQIGHLTYFDGAAVLAISDPDAFGMKIGELLAITPDDDEAMDDLTLGSFRRMAIDDLLRAWRNRRQLLAEASLGLDDARRVPWYGPAMGAKSFLTARLMETWAHGQDIVDAVGFNRPATNRLVHVAQLGFLTRGWSYTNRGLPVPATPIRVELTSPSGDPWSYGPTEATEVVEGPAYDFCLVVTQRRHLDDTALTVTALGRDWLEKAQAFAGPATNGPAARVP